MDIQLLAVDIDGVLTDGTVEVGQVGQRLTRSICFQDMDALSRWKESGKPLAIVTGGKQNQAQGVVRKFDPDVVRYEALDKLQALESVCEELGVPLENTCYIGDADRDASAIKAAGFGVAPRNATKASKLVANKILDRAGGEGCIQELMDLLEEGVNDNIFADSCRVLTDTGFAVGDKLRMAAHYIWQSIERGGKILVAGNGGSAADAQHFVAELMGRFKEERSPFPAIALASNSSNVTAIGNDYGFDDIFARQITALVNHPEDVLVVISTSGNSENIVKAVEAVPAGTVVISLTGKGAGKLRTAGIVLEAESNETARIQECHIAMLHKICELIEVKWWTS